MRKFIITLTVVALILSIIGTGVIVYFDATTPVESEPTVSAE